MPGLDEATFTTLLAQKSALPSPIIQKAGPILFDILAYASAIPFPSLNPNTHLDLDGLIRGVAILIPDRNPLSKGDESSYYVASRIRTKKDARRIIFQGLASPGPHIEEKPSTSETENAISPDPHGFIDVSAEDARTTDLLDALVVSQPDQRPYMSYVARCFWKDVAAALLAAETPQQYKPLYSLRVSKERFRVVLELVLALQAMKCFNSHVVVVEIERETGCFLEQVFVEDGVESVGWQKFYDGVEKTMVSVTIVVLLDRIF